MPEQVGGTKCGECGQESTPVPPRVNIFMCEACESLGVAVNGIIISGGLGHPRSDAPDTLCSGSSAVGIAYGACDMDNLRKAIDRIGDDGMWQPQLIGGV